MAVADLIISAGLLWLGIYISFKLIERFFPRWVASADGVGLSLSLANLKLYTTALNPLFSYLGRSNKTGLSIWFTSGVVFGFVAMLSSVLLLAGNLVWSIAKPTAKDQFLTPVIPGVNVPTTQLWYFFIALLVSGVFHEIGHAIAAVSEGRTVRGFGVFIFLIYPGALVDISNDLHVISPLRQLRIFCAGAWHNFVLVIVAYLVLTTSSMWMAPVFTYPDPRGGAVIASVVPGSALDGLVVPGDTIVQLNEYVIHNDKDWAATFADLYKKKFTPRNICVGQPLLDAAEEIPPICCGSGYEGNLQCWKHVDTTKSFCYAASQIVKKNVDYCTDTVSCPEDSSCVVPVLPEQHLILHLLLGNGTDILFSAHPLSLFHTLKMAELVPRFKTAPAWLFSLPMKLEQLCLYFMSISSALAIINLAPAYQLDGEYTFKAWVQIIFPNWSEEKREAVFRNVFRVVTALLIVNIVVSFVIMYL